MVNQMNNYLRFPLRKLMVFLDCYPHQLVSMGMKRDFYARLGRRYLVNLEKTQFTVSHQVTDPPNHNALHLDHPSHDNPCI